MILTKYIDMRRQRNKEYIDNFYIYHTYLSKEISGYENDLHYIGQRQCPKNKTPETDDYLGSGRRLTGFFRKEFINGTGGKVPAQRIKGLFELFKKDDFKKEILDITNSQLEANELEIKRIKEAKDLYGEKNVINLAEGGHNRIMRGENHHAFGKKKSQETINKLKQYRGEKASHFGKKWFTNGKENFCGKECPDGFKLGLTVEKNSKKRSDSLKKYWNNNNDDIVNLKNERNKKISEKMKNQKGMHYFTNGKINIRAFECPENFWLGITRKGGI